MKLYSTRETWGSEDKIFLFAWQVVLD